MIQPWFAEAKFGIFLHWGIYSVKGITESWSFFNGEISHEEYMGQLAGFTAERYDPEAWADLFVRAGATYAVLTTKHHDGVALWDTAHSDLNVAKATPAGRDLIGPYVEALRKRGLKVGLYFSHLDWNEPTYPTMTKSVYNDARDASPHAFPAEGKEDPETWKRFLAFHRGQLRELCERYRPDILWFDGDWERTDEQWRFAELKEQLQEWAPGVILNSRIGGFGDYETPEQGVPLVAPEGPWEFCVTVNDSWGYQARDENHKSPRQLVRMLAETAGMGGNLLLDIGPYADGSLQPAQVERLEAIGGWVGRHRPAIFGTKVGLPAGHHYGPSTLSRDGRTLYAILLDPPQDEIAVKGIIGEVERVTVLGTGRELAHRMVGGAPWNGVPGVLWVPVPAEACDPLATVLQIELKEPLRLYRGSGHAIQSN